jgi:hypothetical protein
MEEPGQSRGASQPGRVVRWFFVFAAWAVATSMLVLVAVAWIPPERLGIDFLAFWTATTLVAQGLDPYDPVLQAAVQRDLGWQLQKDGLGLYEFLPYFYPPWFTFFLLPLLPLGYSLARLTWMVLCAELTIAAALVTSQTSTRIGGLSAVVFTVLFGQAIRAVWLGQPAGLLLLLAATCWWCLTRHRDATAGALLALLTIKPHITVFLIGSLLVWSIVQRRYRLIGGFAATLAGLLAAATVVVPGWLPAMLVATQVTPLSSAVLPGFGMTWAVVLSTLGVQGFAFGIAWSLVALPFLVLLARMAVSVRAREEDLICGSLIAPFLVIPYAHAYDLTILMLPVLILVDGGRLSSLSGAMLIFAMTFLVDVHIVRLASELVETGVAIGRMHTEYRLFWAPVLVAAAWLYSLTQAPAEAELQAVAAGTR